MFRRFEPASVAHNATPKDEPGNECGLQSHLTKIYSTSEIIHPQHPLQRYHCHNRILSVLYSILGLACDSVNTDIAFLNNRNDIYDHRLTNYFELMLRCWAMVGPSASAVQEGPRRECDDIATSYRSFCTCVQL